MTIDWKVRLWFYLSVGMDGFVIRTPWFNFVWAVWMPRREDHSYWLGFLFAFRFPWERVRDGERIPHSLEVVTGELTMWEMSAKGWMPDDFYSGHLCSRNTPRS